MNLAMVFYRTQRPAEAEMILTRLTQVEPDNPDFHFNLAVVYVGQKKKEAAMAELNAVARLQPDYPGLDRLRQWLGGRD